MPHKLLLIGGGGHCRSVLDCVSALNEYTAVGIVARDAVNAGELEQDPDLAASVVGAGAVARQGIRIGTRALVGAGGVVVRDVPEGARAYGNPCRVMRGQGDW